MTWALILFVISERLWFGDTEISVIIQLLITCSDLHRHLKRKEDIETVSSVSNTQHKVISVQEIC